ncbi:MAG: heavy metal-binding domain-containing protein [Chitinophagaceae bacterium]|nr:heavy metal-binding domain-containing protein [Rubrivivax sp.]
MEDLIEAAKELGADGVFAIDFDCKVMGESNGTVMVAASGTEVRMD